MGRKTKLVVVTPISTDSPTPGFPAIPFPVYENFPTDEDVNDNNNENDARYDTNSPDKMLASTYMFNPDNNEINSPPTILTDSDNIETTIELEKEPTIIELKEGEATIIHEEENEKKSTIIQEEENENKNEEQVSKTPEIIFIVPYRDREQQKSFFASHMKQIMSDYTEDQVLFWYIHQNDYREFNRGAMKNIGFKIVKERYPETYGNITLVFNDIDLMPFTKGFLNYKTTAGVIKHFYGYDFALGGIVSILGQDFEKINGFPNLWAWGFEDNALQHRVMGDAFMKIDRSQFYPILSKHIMHFHDGLMRSVNRTEFNRYMSNTTEGILDITNLTYVDSGDGMLNIQTFDTGTVEKPETRQEFNITHGKQPFPTTKPLPRISGRKRPILKMSFF